MKANKRNLRSQQELMEKKLRPWLKLRGDKKPPSGWIKAVRGALGMTTYQLANRMGVNQATALRLEKREAKGKATLESVEKAARALNCTLIYAIVPNDQYASLDAIITKRSEVLAKKLLKSVEHTMKLEKQGTGTSSSEERKLVEELKQNMDSRIWGEGKTKGE